MTKEQLQKGNQIQEDLEHLNKEKAKIREALRECNILIQSKENQFKNL